MLEKIMLTVFLISALAFSSNWEVCEPQGKVDDLSLSYLQQEEEQLSFIMEATAYCACYHCTGKRPEHPAYGVTASGREVRPGTAAVDPQVIPLGTNLYVEGYGEAAALDTGSMIKGKRLDLYFPDHQQALDWGRREVRVWVLSGKHGW